MDWRLVLLALALMDHLCSGLTVTKVVMDTKEVCKDSNFKQEHKTFWVSEQKSVLVIGRSKDTAVFNNCSIIVGAATQDSRMLQLSFDAFHISDCAVVLSINQSSHSDFERDNSPMAQIGCNHGNIRLLHSKPKHFVKIHVHKRDKYVQGYSFRINITLAEDPQETGPALHVVVIVGIVSLFVVAIALYLLVKYLLHRSQRWNEHCAERNMERAIHLYNSQEAHLPPESDYMYTALPAEHASTISTISSSHRNGVGRPRKKSGGRGGRHREGDITFVHADGHIETFRMRDSPQGERHQRDLQPSDRAAITPATTVGNISTASGAGDENHEDGEIHGECPPSYEEAINMPAPNDPRLYVNLDSKSDDNHAT